MEYIFLDTNIFVKENFLEGNRINELLKLSRLEIITIVMAQITVDEVKAQYKKRIKTALSNLGEFRNAYENHCLRNFSKGKTHIFERVRQKDILEEFDKKLVELLQKSNVEIIPYYALDCESVFKKYFSGQKPFNREDKKHEFPDAFALEHLKKWCVESGEFCTVFTSDKDFTNESTFITANKNYEIYLDSKLKEILETRNSILNEIFHSNSSWIDAEIKTWYEENLTDESHYYHFVFFEIHDIEVDDVVINEKTYQIVSIDDETIDIEVEVDLTYTVTLIIDDDEFSYYDSDDKMTYYAQTKPLTITRNVKASMLLRAYIVSQSEYDDSFDLIEINKDTSFHINDDLYGYDYV